MKFLTLFLFALLILPLVAAFEFDNVKNYDDTTSKYGTITITNAFGFGDKLAEYTLDYNTDICIINCEARGTAILYDEGYLFTDLKFKDKSNSFTDINSNEILIYKNISYQYLDENNKTLTRYYMGWITYDNTELPIGTYGWKIKGVKNPHDEVDWIGSAFGEDFTEWAWWDVLTENFEAFTSSGTFTVPDGVKNVSVVVVAGGGGGGTGGDYDDNTDSAGGGGGGAGGLIFNGSFPVIANSDITVTIGDGGPENSNGQNSVFGTLTAVGGGAGGSGSPTEVGSNGGSGGGGAGEGESEEGTHAGGTGTAAQGNDGGTGGDAVPTDHGGGGGGGGAGVVGANAVNEDGGNGGNGVELWGIEYLAGGGGGGEGRGSVSPGTGGLGGGANGGPTENAGTVNTGGGGGGGEGTNVNDKPGGAGGSGLVIVKWDTPIVNLLYPINNSNLSVSDIDFSVNITDFNGLITIKNVSLLINGTITQTNISDFVGIYNFTETLSDAKYNWSITAYDSNDIEYNTTARVLTINANPPDVKITYPLTYVNYLNNGTNLTINFTRNDIDSCWYDYSGTNISMDCNSNLSIMISNYSNRNITFYLNDSYGLENSSSTTWNYHAFQNLPIVRNETAYETSIEKYVINISSDGTETMSAVFDFNGTRYTATKTGTNSEMLFTNTLKLNSTHLGNNTFHWIINYGGSLVNSTNSSQFVKPLEFNLCNTTLIDNYINFTFKNEETLGFENATADASTFNFWLGDGTYTKQLLFTNTTENPSYAFCSNGHNKTLHNNITFRYASTGYPQRIGVLDVDLTNTTRNQLLYLLASTDGSYTSFNVQSSLGQALSGVDVTVERKFSGAWVTIGNDDTDVSGAVTFWVNPDYDHRFTFTKTGYDVRTLEIRPVQSSYTLILEGLASNASYTSTMEGIKFQISPGSGFLSENTNYSFSFNVSAALLNLVYYSINLSDGDGNQLTSMGGTNAAGSNLSFIYNTGDTKTMYGRYYIDTGNGTFLIDPSIWPVKNVTAGPTSIRTFLTDLTNFNTNPENNFATLFFFFFILFLTMAVVSRMSGIEMQAPGLVIGLVWFIVIAASFGNFLPLPIAPSEGATVNPFFQQFGISLVITFMFFGFMLRRFSD